MTNFEGTRGNSSFLSAIDLFYQYLRLQTLNQIYFSFDQVLCAYNFLFSSDPSEAKTKCAI